MKTFDDFILKSKNLGEGVEWGEVRLGDIFLQYGYTQKARRYKCCPKFLRTTDIELETSQVKCDKVSYCEDLLNTNLMTEIY